MSRTAPPPTPPPAVAPPRRAHLVRELPTPWARRRKDRAPPRRRRRRRRRLAVGSPSIAYGRLRDPHVPRLLLGYAMLCDAMGMRCDAMGSPG